jgi:hypothetical protein
MTNRKTSSEFLIHNPAAISFRRFPIRLFLIRP